MSSCWHGKHFTPYPSWLVVGIFLRHLMANSVVLVNLFPVCAQWAILSLTSLTPNRLTSA